MHKTVRQALAGILICVWFLTARGATAQRPPGFADFFKFQDLKETVLSPDGRSVAFVLDRPANTSHELLSGYIRTVGPWVDDLRPNRADVWIVSDNQKRSMNISNGDIDGASFWSPQWSPDGQRLLFLSTRGNELRYWAWSRSSGKLQKLLRPDCRLEIADAHWISNREIILAGVGDNAPSQTPVFAEAANTGRIRSPNPALVSVLDSGLSKTSVALPEVALYRVDVQTGKQVLLVRVPGLGHPILSPDRQKLAFQRERRTALDPEAPLPASHDRTFEVLGMDFKHPHDVRTFRGMADLSTTQYGGLDVAWSPDSTEILVSRLPIQRQGPDRLFRCRFADAACSVLSSDTGNSAAAMFVPAKGSPVWYGDHELLVRGWLGSDLQARSREKSNSTWWGVDSDGKFHPFFIDFNGAVESPILLPGNSGFVGLARDSIWKFNAAGHALQNLTSGYPGTVLSIFGISAIRVGSDDRSSPPPPSKTIVFRAMGSNSHIEVLQASLASGEIIPITTPSPTAELLSLDDNGAIVFRDLSNGTRLWLTENGGQNFVTALDTNRFVRSLRPFETRTIEYVTNGGERVAASVLLPPGFEEGKRYPVVVSVYPSTVIQPEDDKKSLSAIEPADAQNMQLLAAHGYVVLTPSMPGFGVSTRQSPGEVADKTKDPYLRLTDGVLPAIDKLIDVGIADPHRIGVIGISFGGYAVYGLITQTNRFQAAVSLAGFADLVSFYGTFDPNLRYSSYSALDTWSMDWAEFPFGLGSPPWRDLDRYTRNSPLTYADRVRTPLMMVKGDMDYVPMEQGEEFFRALQRQNKPVRFVRYWGQGHDIDRSDDLQDLWQKIYAWFDEFLIRGEMQDRDSD